MNRILTGICIWLVVVLLQPQVAHGQEYEGHLLCNPALYGAQKPVLPAKKTTVADPLSLPFLEDFTNYSVFPDPNKWTDFGVFINNTMGYKPISRGVATFDALDSRGIPYDSFSNTNFRPADTLTSLPINLSLDIVTPGDSIYLSFFYQPQGKGFYPLPQDSLMLYLRTRFGGFVKIWSQPGTTLKPFQQVMIPIYDSLYFDSFFQFRFINKAGLYWADAVWNVDYIRLNRGRNMYDTLVNDIGFSSEPTFYLNDYTSMPYRQLIAYPAAERASQYTASLRNNYDVTQSVIYGYTGTCINTGTLLKPLTLFPATLSAQSSQQLTFGSYNTLVPISGVGNYGQVVFQNKHYIETISPLDPTGNDTIIKNHIFDNYLAYDDGTAEKSYYLNLYPTLPGKIAIEYHLNKPDTMRGMAIYFGRQVPFPSYKYFNINVYSDIAGINGSPADNLLYSQELCTPGYADTLNNFWVYKFDAGLPLPAGVFYAGTFQPAESGSDSLYFGLDVNRIGSNHAYYNVLSSWLPSLISGAIMMRPLFGQEITGTTVTSIKPKRREWAINPNPAKDNIRFEYNGDAGAEYTITDIQGRKVLQGIVENEGIIDVSQLAPALYFVHLSNNGLEYNTQKFIKL